MEETYLRKMLVFACVMLLIGTGSFAAVASNTPRESVTVTVTDTTTGQRTSTELSAQDAEKIIEAFMTQGMTADGFCSQLQERLSVLSETGLISERTAQWLMKSAEARQSLSQRLSARPNPFFSVANFINVVVFGLKGQNDRAIFELNPIQYPFFNGTISAQFVLASKYSGNGTVFSLGLLGWKYVYEQNQTLYPDFPYFPGVSGGVIFFTGIVVNIESNETYPGEYILGVGMSFVTIWNRA